MLDNSDSNQIDPSDSSSDSTESRQPVPNNGPETVINPERRSRATAARDGESDSKVVRPESEVWNQLFPPEAESHTGGIVEGPDGIQLGHFLIEERIGMGGMGAVFRATDVRLQRVVALKVLSPEQSLDEAAVQRFKNEGCSAARLDHDNIARVFFIGEDKGLHFIAFEFVTGTNVLEMIRKNGRMHPTEAVNYALQIASALKHTSIQGVVHRDIKPSNIIITPTGRAKLVDLGLARKANSESAADLTMAGTTLGTFDYISPEQAKDPRNVDVRSDIYSLGCTLYHILTGQPPYPEGTVLQKLLDHQGKEAPDPAKLNRNVSDDLSAIVKKMMASDPRRRYATADLLIHDLMLMAGTLGLRGMHPDGLVWTSGEPNKNQFWGKHLGWIVTVASMLIIVTVLQAFPDIGRNVSDFNENKSTSNAEQLAANSNATQDQDRSDSTEATQSNANGVTSKKNITESNTTDASKGATTAPKTESSTDRVASTNRINPTPINNNPENGILQDKNLKPITDFGKSDQDDSNTNQSTNATTTTDTDTQKNKTASPPAKSGDDKSVAETVNRTDTGDAKAIPPAAELLPIVAYDEDGKVTKKYRSLEAACSEILDGGTILLNYNGARRENPIRITKKNVTIRPGEGFQPVVEFVPERALTEGFRERMITVTNGPVNLRNLHIRVAIPEQVESSTDLAVIAIDRPQSVRLKRLTITVENSSNCTVSVARLESPPRSMLSDMMMKNNSGFVGIDVEMQECLIRGAGDLFSIRQAESVRVAVEDSAVAIGGSVVRVEGNSESPEEDARFELKFEHSSYVFGRHLVTMNTDVFPGKLPPTNIQSTDNIFSGVGDSSLVSMTGSLETEEFQDLLEWSGEKNYYDNFDRFWVVPSAEDELDHDAWKLFWSQSSEVDGTNQSIVWVEPRPRLEDMASVRASVFSLVSDLTLNPAVAGATDGDDAGVDLVKLPLIPLKMIPD